MKTIFNISVFVILTAFFSNIVAQPQITGDCSSVSFAGGMPEYEVNLFENGAFPPNQPCLAFVSIPPMQPRMFLQQFNFATNQFVTIAGPRVVNQPFTNLVHGTYRIKLQVPRRLFRAACENGHIPAYDWSYRHVGWIGHYSEETGGDFPGTFFSNEVVVGMTTPADIAFTFIDEPETGPETAYDYGEPVKINTSQCKNYNRWMIAIIEDGGQNRYMSTGWMSGKIGGNGQSLSLTELWQGWITWWQFEPLHSYHVQVVLENNECPNPSWNQLIRTFFVCPTGSGCRLGEPEEPQIRLGPNPAHSSFFLYNYDAGFYSGSLMIISDMAGRTKKTIPLTGNEIDVSAIPAGVYAVQLVHEGKRVFSSKLVVSR